MFKSIIVLGAALMLSACSQITPETPPVIDISETSEATLQEVVTELEEIVEVEVTTEVIPEPEADSTVTLDPTLDSTPAGAPTEVPETEATITPLVETNSEVDPTLAATPPERETTEAPNNTAPLSTTPTEADNPPERVEAEPVVVAEATPTIEFVEDTAAVAAAEAEAARQEQVRVAAEKAEADRIATENAAAQAEEERLSAEQEAAYAAEQEAARAEQARVAAEIAAAEAAKNEIKTLGSGQFVGVDSRYQGSGGITVKQMGDEVLLQVQNNFSVTAGPDLYLYISQPQTYGSTAKNGADLSRMKLISALSSNTGAQTYKISKADWDNYGHSIVIWCKAYSVRFSHATIN